jgi:hypothetical protein
LELPRPFGPVLSCPEYIFTGPKVNFGIMFSKIVVKQHIKNKLVEPAEVGHGSL